MGKDNRDRARDLLQGVGKSLGPRETKRIADSSRLSDKQVASIAARRGIDTARAKPPAPAVSPLNRSQAPIYQNLGSFGSWERTPTKYVAAPGRPSWDPDQRSTESPSPSPTSTPAPTTAPAAGAVDDYSKLFASWSKAFGGRDEVDRLRSELSTARAEREDARARVQQYERQREEERGMRADEQLRSLRSGSTAAGGSGAGLGSLTSGGSAYSTSSRQRGGDTYDSYRKSAGTVGARDRDSGPAAQEPEAGRRDRSSSSQSLTAGSAGGYYGRRFG